MQLTDPKEAEAKIMARYQVLLILWIAMLVSLFIFFVMAFVIPSSAQPNATVSLVLLGASLLTVIGSMLLKNHFLKRAIEKQDLQLLQNAYVTGFALCDVSVLLGLFDHLAFNSRYFYFAFIVAAVGLLLHFPKPDHVRAVSFKQF